MTGRLIIVSHPEVVVAPTTPITDWGLSELGRARAMAFAGSAIMSSVSAIWSSTEVKAHETADILAAPLGLTVATDPALGENDRSATGFLPPPEFEAAADAFFAKPDISFCGWETAQAAQARIAGAVTNIAAGHDGKDLAIVTHGAVGTLLWCHLSRQPINREFDQPGQGHFWWADLATLEPNGGWQPIA